MSSVSCRMSYVSYLVGRVSHFVVSRVWCLVSRVSCVVTPISCVVCDVSYLVVDDTRHQSQDTRHELQDTRDDTKFETTLHLVSRRLPAAGLAVTFASTTERAASVQEEAHRLVECPFRTALGTPFGGLPKVVRESTFSPFVEHFFSNCRATFSPEVRP